MDWFNGTHPNATVSIALAKLPAKVPVDDPRYGGPILINPGGPGGSGVWLALLQAPAIQAVVDSSVDPSVFQDPSSSPDAKYFDVIGFDPRGIGQTEPPARCFNDGAYWWSWRLRESDEGFLDSSDAAVGRLWAKNHAYGGSCADHVEGEDGADIKSYMTTASVARDMLEIAEKHSEYVAKKASKQCGSKIRQCAQSGVSTYEPGTAKLQYWGFSYGTYLGYTFASMFPDRVGRLVLDGVVNSDDYNQSLGNGSLHDAEKTMTSFYTFCFQSGPEVCPLATSASSVKDIETRTQAIIKSLYHSPLALQTLNGPEVFTYSDLRGILFASLYSPIATFPIVARLLEAVELGKGEFLDQVGMAFSLTHVYHCPINGTIFDVDVPEWGILCSDGDSQASETIEDFEEYLNTLSTTSPTSGAIWSILRLKCISWKIRAVHRFEGDFGAKTSEPILFISNTADPVTPLRSGRIMHERFPGSGHLVQDSAGHCTLAQPIACSIKHIRDYFQSGKLPAPGTVCVPPTTPFSLNSTDPSSIFYEPSLGNAISIYDSPLSSDIDANTLAAGQQIHQWLVANSFWPTGGHRRTYEILSSGLLGQ
jgi:pimeloyl-ACP methyl ester carboxylesterase